MDFFQQMKLKRVNFKVMLNPVVNTSVERVIWDIDKRRFHRNMSLVLNRYLKYTIGDLYPNEFKSNNDNLKDLEVNRGLQYESDEWEDDTFLTITIESILRDIKNTSTD